MMSQLTVQERVMGCWLGKGVGGTLGMPFEGVEGPLGLKYYQPCPTKPAPNDDLDLQLLWLYLLEEHGRDFGGAHLADAWLRHQQMEFDEYGVARWNLSHGVEAPLTGRLHNPFTRGMGAAIRSEIWACVFPGEPGLAAAYAKLDAQVDHDGEGVWAEMFLSGMQSAAFTSAGIDEAIDAGLGVIPKESALHAVVGEVRGYKAAGRTGEESRALLLEKYKSENFTDCVMNLAIIINALVFAQGDFEQAVLLAVNGGQDTDCTGATTGATYGIMFGPRSIPARWGDPVGKTIAVSDFLKPLPVPRTLEDLTRRTLAVSQVMHKGGAPAAPAWREPGPGAKGHPMDISWRVWAGDSATEPGMAQARALLSGGSDACAQKWETWLCPVGQVARDLPESVWLAGWLTVDEDLQGQLMAVADTGLTLWLDGQQVLNYHGRRRLIPAFHRTEGGASLPVSLKKGKPVEVVARVLFPRPEHRFGVAVGTLGSKFVDFKVG
jgi:ADP-ribosylglycohydrolase